MIQRTPSQIAIRGSGVRWPMADGSGVKMTHENEMEENLWKFLSKEFHLRG